MGRPVARRAKTPLYRRVPHSLRRLQRVRSLTSPAVALLVSVPTDTSLLGLSRSRAKRGSCDEKLAFGRIERLQFHDYPRTLRENQPGPEVINLTGLCRKRDRLCHLRAGGEARLPICAQPMIPGADRKEKISVIIVGSDQAPSSPTRVVTVRTSNPP